MSRGISKLQRKILEVVSIPGEPVGLPREVIQAQLWPTTFEHDYRYTAESPRRVKEKKKRRVTLSRAISSLVRRGLVEDKWQGRISAHEVHRRGLVLPYQLKHPADGKPNNGDALGYFIVRTDN